MVLNILRTAEGPLECREIARRVLQQRGEPTDDRRGMNSMSKRVSWCLRDKLNQGVARSSQGKGQALLWEVVR